MKNIFVILCLLALTSCASTMHEDPRHVPKFAPANYKPVGIVKYLNDGAGYFVKARREDAFEKMHKSCDGSYEVLKETSFYEGGSEYWYIQFQCMNKAASN